jgi:predicted RecA/RadA family phage recombinase
MAKNQRLQLGNHLRIAVGSGEVSGNPISVGMIAGVLLTDRDADGVATMCRVGSFNLSVKGIDQSGNSAVAVGDKLFCVNADTPRVSKKNTGVFIGWALGTVTSAATSTIEVLMAGGSHS